MSSRPFSKLSSPLYGAAAAIGLLAVAALTVSNMDGQTRFDLRLLLVGIWAVYVLQLIETLIRQPEKGAQGGMPVAIIDVLAVLVPLAAFLFAGGRDQSLYCTIWLLKPLRNSVFFRLLGRVVKNEAHNLIGVTTIFCIVLFAAAAAAYVIERDVQPDQFGSIPQAMWWAVVTLSTTGYGDEIPRTLAGRVLAGLVMMSGIGIFALWAGLLATGFYEEVRRQDFVRNWQLVAAVPLFQKLGSAALVEIVRALRPRVVPAGSIICRQGETGDQMYFICRGPRQRCDADPRGAWHRQLLRRDGIDNGRATLGNRQRRHRGIAAVAVLGGFPDTVEQQPGYRRYHPQDRTRTTRRDTQGLKA